MRTRGAQRGAGWAYAAFAVGALYALVSAYWGAGGTRGLDTVGGELEELARRRDPALLAVVWLTAALKLAAALLGVALVRRWGRRLPRRLLRAAAGGASAVLVAYGGLLVVVQALVEADVVEPSGDVDRTALRWHLYLWDPWFLVWGVLLGVATWRSRPSAGERARAAR